MCMYLFLSQPVIHDCDIWLKFEVSEPRNEQSFYPETWYRAAGWPCYVSGSWGWCFIALGFCWCEWSAGVTLPVVQNIAAWFRIYIVMTQENKKHLSLLGSCEPVYHRRTNAWFKIQVYSCCSMFFPIAMSSVLVINSVKWRPVFLQQGLYIQHKRSCSSCSSCWPWLCAWGFWNYHLPSQQPRVNGRSCLNQFVVLCPGQWGEKKGKGPLIISFSFIPHHKVGLFSRCFCSFSP